MSVDIMKLLCSYLPNSYTFYFRIVRNRAAEKAKMSPSGQSSPNGLGESGQPTTSPNGDILQRSSGGGYTISGILNTPTTAKRKGDNEQGQNQLKFDKSNNIKY